MNNNQFKYIGKSYPTHDALDKAMGRTKYTADMRPQGMLFAKMLFSSCPHGRILSIDTSKAEALPGVRCVLTCFNTTNYIYNSARRFIGHNMKPDETVFSQKVRYIGDRVAAVAADTEEIAAQAVKLIKVEYEEMPAVYDVIDAVKKEAPEIHEGGNVLGTVEIDVGDAEKAIKNATYVFEESCQVPAVHHFAMEPHAVLADYDGKHLTVWTSTQNIFAFRTLLADICKLPVNSIRVIRPPAGGGFGGKYEMVLEPVVALLAQKTCRPVLLELSRKDSMISTRTKHGAIVDIKIGIDRDYHIAGIDYQIRLNAGAYAGSSMNVLGGASAKSMMLYRLPSVHYKGIGIYTNTPVGGAMRGYGSQQIETPLELLMDRIADELDIDPVMFRLKNLVYPGDMNPAKHISLGNARIRDCLTKGASMIGWTPEVRVSNDGRFRRAMGFACGVHGNGVSGIMMDTTTIQLRVAEDGSVTLYTGTQDIGQGNTMLLKMIIGETLQINPLFIEVYEADTGTTPFDNGTFGSRCTWVAGEAARRAAEKLIQLLKKEAAEAMGVKVEELIIENGSIVCRDKPEEAMTYGEIALYSQQVSNHGEPFVNEVYYSEHNPGTYAVDFAEVEVDTETGNTKVLKVVAVHDVGRALNPLALEGQIEGGVQMGIGYGLREELLINKETGEVTNAHAKKYKILRAHEMPQIETAFIEENEEFGPYGAKSIGEMATIAVGAACVNAVNRALNTHITRLPATPERVMSALAKKADEI